MSALQLLPEDKRLSIGIFDLNTDKNRNSLHVTALNSLKYYNISHFKPIRLGMRQVHIKSAKPISIKRFNNIP